MNGRHQFIPVSVVATPPRPPSFRDVEFDTRSSILRSVHEPHLAREYNSPMHSLSRASLIALAAGAFALAASPGYLTFIGNFGTAIPVFQLDTASGKLKPLGSDTMTKTPAWLTISSNGKFLYAVNEQADSVSAFALDSKAAKLTPLNTLSTKGKGPCHVAVDHTGKALFVANYGSGSLESFTIKSDGSIGERASFIQNEGSSADKSRQKGPHAHSANISPDNRFLVLADLGLDKLLVFKLDPATAKLTPNDPPFASVKPGSGPRHFVFSPDSKFGYVINEMGNIIIGFSFDKQKGSLKEIQTVSTLPDDFKGSNNSTAEIAISSDGRFLYGSNRGVGTIAVYSVDKNTGMLAKIQDAATGGTTIRSFGIDPTGEFVLAGLQEKNTVVEFRRDKSTGKLTLTGEKVDTPTPVCVIFHAAK
jgi:6-phosphogluconolactonase